jgi:diadenylate cyclase
MKFLDGPIVPDQRGIVEIIVLAIFFYYCILFFKGTRGASVLSGFVLLLVVLMMATKWAELDALSWLFQKVSVYLAIAIVVIFQPEIRRALAEVGKQHVFGNSRAGRDLVDHLVQAVVRLSENKIGALIAIEREIGTRSVQETGTIIDADLTSELLMTIFYPYTPLHDGGVIIRNGRIHSAACVFPLCQDCKESRPLGTRHRAAMGLTEETDAVALVVSEETGAISLAYKGKLSHDLDEKRLGKMLSTMLIGGRKSSSRLSRVQEQLDLTPAGVAKTDQS